MHTRRPKLRAQIIDRESEISALDELAEGGGRKLVLLTGRRRVGKTFLLTKLWEPARTFYFTASATTPEVNRRAVVAEAAAWSGRDLRPEDHPTWRTVFRTILELAPELDAVIVLDEVQYLASDERGLLEVASELNAVWEGPLHRSGGLLLVLCGSAIRTLEALQKGGSPLYGRLAWSGALQPFDYFDAGRMVAAYDPIDRVRTYASFGGMPRYLSAVDTSRPLERNIVERILSPGGEVRLQLETALSQEEGIREFARYQGVLAATGIKRRGIGEIAAAVGHSLDGAFRRVVSNLVDMGFLEAERGFEEPGNQALRYRVADPALRMYFGLVLPNESAIASAGAQVVWRERLARQVFPAYVGQHVFEDVVRQAYLRHWEAKGIPAVARWGRWAGTDREGRDLEIDVVARLLDGRVLTGSSKMRARPSGADVLVRHLTDLQRLADSGRGWAREALAGDAPMLFASAAGFKPSFREAADDLGHPVTLWGLDDLF